jgi:hypothetical protein
MEPYRGFGGRKTLLPYEVELCNTLGITSEEYFEFVESVAEYAKNRNKGYELIPDIQAGPLLVYNAAGVAIGLSTLGQIVLGVALNVIAYLLTPKPKTPETPPSLTTGGVQGRSRFSPQYDFDSVQELAALGTFIPLVYSRTGVRVNSQLLWSQIKTLSLGEILSVVTLFSHGEIGEKPAYSTFAIGDSLLDNFSNRKVALYFTEGASRSNRINNSHRYSETIAPDTTTLPNRGGREYDTGDPFSVKLETGASSIEFTEATSGVKTSFTQTRFGLHAPMPNGNAFRVPWEIVLFPLDGDDDIKNKESPHKIRKILTKYPRYCAFIPTTTFPQNTLCIAEENQELTYRIFGTANEQAFIEQPLTHEGTRLFGDSSFFTSRGLELFVTGDSRDHDKCAPWGSEDCKAAVDSVRNNADDNITAGQQYMLGTALVTCTYDQGTIWSPDSNSAKDYKFTVDERGVVQAQKYDDIKAPYETLNLHRVALGIMSNTKNCDITEIGIKSKVFRRINGFPNLNAVPSAHVILDTEDRNGSISVGAMAKYVVRYSFFLFQARVQGVDSPFKTVCDKILCIKGDSPVEKYNTITVKHTADDNLYEYRFLPVPGNAVLRESIVINDVYARNKFYVLNHSSPVWINRFRSFPNQGGTFMDIIIHAEETTIPSSNKYHEGDGVTNNPEWFRYNDNPLQAAPRGITRLQRLSNNHTDPTTIGATWSVEVFNDGVAASNILDPNRGLAAVYIRTANSGWRLHIWAAMLNEVPASQSASNKSQLETQIEKMGKDGVMRRITVGAQGTGASDTGTRSNGDQFWQHRITVEKQDSLPTHTLLTSTVDVEGGNGTGATATVFRYAGYSFRRWQIENGGTNYNVGDRVTIDGNTVTVTEVDTTTTGNTTTIESRLTDLDTNSSRSMRLQKPYFLEESYNPNNKIADYFLYEAEESSHESSPEHEIVFMNEITLPPSPNAGVEYPKLAMAGLRINSSKEFEAFSQLSAIIEKGVKVNLLSSNSSPYTEIASDGTKDSTNNFPEIAYDLMTNSDYGAAEHIGSLGVSRSNMQKASRFCKQNNLNWDGIVDRRFNLRDFIFEHAGYNFLHFNILGGQFSLSPALPYKNDFTIDFDAVMGSNSLPVKALFTDGNIKDLEVSFLPPEERQMFKAVITYRKPYRRKDGKIVNNFVENDTMVIAYIDSGTNLEQLPEEVFDFSNWCVSSSHVMLFAAIALSTRKLVDHAVKFQTSPTSVLGLAPGDYIRLISEATHTSRFDNGLITQEGEVVSREPLSGSKQIYYWEPGSTNGVRETTIQITNGKVANGPTDVLFTIKTSSTTDRIYKVESMTYGEEGFVEVTGTHVPLTSDNKLAILHKVDPSKSTYGDVFEVMD